MGKGMDCFFGGDFLDFLEIAACLLITPKSRT
jgi:hypothetical protein